MHIQKFLQLIMFTLVQEKRGEQIDIHAVHAVVHMCVWDKLLSTYVDAPIIIAVVAGIFCNGCSCVDCFNVPGHANTVLRKRAEIEKRNPNAFAVGKAKVCAKCDASNTCMAKLYYMLQLKQRG